MTSFWVDTQRGFVSLYRVLQLQTVVISHIPYPICLSSYPTSHLQSLPFLPLYTWVGLWTAGLLGVCRYQTTDYRLHTTIA